jgi:hypothetical protein
MITAEGAINAAVEFTFAPGTYQKPYSVFKVLKPFEVEASMAAPWFGEPGGGMQFKLGKSVSDLIKEGYLKKVP